MIDPYKLARILDKKSKGRLPAGLSDIYSFIKAFDRINYIINKNPVPVNVMEHQNKKRDIYMKVLAKELSHHYFFIINTLYKNKDLRSSIRIKGDRMVANGEIKYNWMVIEDIY